MQEIINNVANQIWYIELFVLLGGGVFFLLYSKGKPLRYFFHAFRILFQAEKSKIKGQINPFRALATSLASTIGLGNIAGVAIAISLGGPGALFWMWVTAFIGMYSNFFTTTLALLYKGKDSRGELQGGTMYVIREGLSKKWNFMGYIYSLACLLGVLPIFQANQLTSICTEVVFNDTASLSQTFMFLGNEISYIHLFFGIGLAILVGIVILGGISRIAEVASFFVPVMIVIYFFSVMIIVIENAGAVFPIFKNIFVSAFTTEGYSGDTFLGGFLGGLILIGVRRASFSSEAGLGTTTLAMGASYSANPVRQGFISMITPFLDTIVVSSLTALAILITGVWQDTSVGGIEMTLHAFNVALPYGKYILLVCVIFFSFSSLFSYSYYGVKSLSFVVGVRKGYLYNYFFLFTIIIGSTASLSFVVNIVDIGFGIMAFPSILSAILLRKKVVEQLDSYKKYS